MALTAHAMKGDDLACREAGMDDHLTKPVDRELLEACIQRYLHDEPAATVAASMECPNHEELGDAIELAISHLRAHGYYVSA